MSTTGQYSPYSPVQRARTHGKKVHPLFERAGATLDHVLNTSDNDVCLFTCPLISSE